MTNELKSCPFCGGEAMPHPDCSPCVKCTECGAVVRFRGTPEMEAAWSQGLVMGITSDVREHEAKCWNTRHKRTCSLSQCSDGWECSNCGYVATHRLVNRFCPGCGAEVTDGD